LNEEVCSNGSSGLSKLTRSGRYYTSEELEKRKKELARVQPSQSRIGSSLKKLRNFEDYLKG